MLKKKSSHYRHLLLSIIALSFLFFLLSIIQIALGNIAGFQPLFYGFGFILYSAFNWADMLVFSLLWIILSCILLKMIQKEYFLIAFFSFWLIRSSGEVFYSFLQQFHPETKPWLSYTPRALMQNTYVGNFILLKYWVIEQILFQSIAVLSLFGLIYAASKILGDKHK